MWIEKKEGHLHPSTTRGYLEDLGTFPEEFHGAPPDRPTCPALSRLLTHSRTSMASKTPLLAEQKQAPTQEVPAPKPAQKVRKKKEPYFGAYDKTIRAALRRCALLYSGLLLATYFAGTAFCQGFLWPVFLLSCNSLFSTEYQTLNGSGHPEW